jgi:hypothetical protein
MAHMLEAHRVDPQTMLHRLTGSRLLRET